MSISKIVKPRMGKNIFHPSIHLFTNYWLADQVTVAAKGIKKLIFGDENAATYYKGPDGCAQLAVQTEFTVSEFSSHSKVSDAFDLLDQRLDALFDEGIAVHLLLPVHDLPADNWQGVDWNALKTDWPGATFDPYQPFINDTVNGNKCGYDVVSEFFHKPIIEHLIETGRMQNLAVIYLMNEFGYPSNTILDSADNWGGAGNWMEIRAEALANTAERILSNGRKFAVSTVPVGLKFATLTSQNTGWTPRSKDYPDQLANILGLMSENKDVFAFDLYFTEDDLYDESDRNRIEPFLSMFELGFFEIGESGLLCKGGPGQFEQGSRTSSKDIVGACDYWSEAQGYNLFAWNVSSPDQGCYSITNASGVTFSDAEGEGIGIWDLFIRATGNEDKLILPRGLKAFFILHFVVDMIFAIPLMFFPHETLSLFGMNVAGTLFPRLVAAALFGIGGISFLAHSADKESYKNLLTMKNIWSISALIAITLAIVELNSYSSRPFYSMLLVFFTFFAFAIVWIYYRWKISK